ncbi:MAG: DUF2892 domain-containing protein [Alphaproteobacteria bacterium]|jgi:rhodanese-related sulfurtransferase|nr:DUF2892 domain-containing protein [Alphaproteobacteria bacterium]
MNEIEFTDHNIKRHVITIKDTHNSYLILLFIIATWLINSLSVEASDTVNNNYLITNVISPSELRLMLDTGDTELIDVRNTEEFVARHIKEARSVPLSILDLSQICDKTKKIVLQCESGARSKLAAKKLQALSKDLKIYSLDGGIRNWVEKNYATVEGIAANNKLPLNRQVQITAGIIIVLGIVLTKLISRLFIIIPLFIGCGLIFAGISGWCGMASLLALMPWN